MYVIGIIIFGSFIIGSFFVLVMVRDIKYAWKITQYRFELLKFFIINIKRIAPKWYRMLADSYAKQRVKQKSDEYQVHTQTNNDPSEKPPP